MKTKLIKRFEKSEYFYKWLQRHDRFCDCCGVRAEIQVSVFNSPYKRGEESDYIFICERCLSKLNGSGCYDD